VGVEFVGPAGQTLPQPLQFCGSLVSSTQAVPQSVGLGAMQPFSQLVPSHCGIELGHVTLQPPQLGEVEVFVSHPSSGLLEQ
jgi:hypothetical protein